MAEAWLIAGDLDRAQELATRALTHAGERGERWFEARASKILGDVEARRRPLDAERCARHYHDALRLAAARGLAPLVAQCQAGLTQLGVGDPAV
jgi:hypothetical protein